MKRVDIAREKRRLDNLFQRTGDLPQDPEILAHWSRYLCVLVSGFIETSVCTIYSQYVTDKAHPNVANYVTRRLNTFRNPNMERILEVTRAFSPEWEKQLRDGTAEELKAAIDSVVANRNQIAHGKNVQLSYVMIKDYYARAAKLIDMMFEQCDA